MQRATGMVTDRPWGIALAELARESFTGTVTVAADDKAYAISFDLGLVVAATSPLATDAAARVALTNHLISSSQVANIARRIAAEPDRDEVDVLADAAHLTPAQVQTLRTRLVTQRAARTFAIAHGTFSIEDRIAVPACSAVDVRAVIYHGARLNLSEQHLTTALRELGSYFVLSPAAPEATLEALASYGFGDAEQPILRALATGTTLPELEAAHREVDPRTAQAVVYTLVTTGACAAEQRAAPTPAPASAAMPPPRATAPTEGATYAISRTVTGATISRTVTDVRTRAASAQPSSPPAVGRAPTGQLVTPQLRAGELEPGGDPSPPRTPTEPTVRFRTPSTGAPPTVPRATTGPVVGRTPTPTPTTAPRRAPTTSSPAISRTVTPVKATVGRTPTPSLGRAPTGSGARPARTSTAPAISRTSTVRRTQALIAARALLVEQGADHFAILGVPFGAPSDAVRTAYLNLVRQLHPDKLTELEITDPGAHRLFAQIGVAFSVLTDPPKREAYLAHLSEGAPVGGRPRTRTVDELPGTPAAQAYRRGEAALRRDEPLEAVAALRHASQLEPANVDYGAMLGWAVFCAATDKVTAAPEARKALERAIQKSAKPLHARFLLGRVERMVGRDKEALRHFEEVVEQMPNHAEAASEIRVIQARLASAARKR